MIKRVSKYILTILIFIIIFSVTNKMIPKGTVLEVLSEIINSPNRLWYFISIGAGGFILFFYLRSNAFKKHKETGVMLISIVLALMFLSTNFAWLYGDVNFLNKKEKVSQVDTIVQKQQNKQLIQKKKVFEIQPTQEKKEPVNQITELKKKIDFGIDKTKIKDPEILRKYENLKNLNIKQRTVEISIIKQYIRNLEK